MEKYIEGHGEIRLDQEEVQSHYRWFKDQMSSFKSGIFAYVHKGDSPDPLFEEVFNQVYYAQANKPHQITSSGLLDAALTTWEKDGFQYPVHSPLLTIVRRETDQRAKERIGRIIDERLQRQAITDLEGFQIIDIAIALEDSLLFEALVSRYPRFCSQFTGQNFLKTNPSFKKKAAEATLAALGTYEEATYGYFQRVKLDAYLLLERLEEASAILDEEIAENPRACDLPDYAIKIERSNLALFLLLSHLKEVKDFSREWRDLGKKISLLETEKRQDFHAFLSYLLFEGISRQDDQKSLRAEVKESSAASLPPRELIPFLPKEQVKGALVEYDPDREKKELAAVYYFQGVALGRAETRSEGISFLRGIKEKSLLQGHWETLSTLALVFADSGETEDALGVLRALVKKDLETARQYSDLILVALAPNLKVKMLVETFFKIQKIAGFSPRIDRVIERLIEQERAEDAQKFLVETDKLAKDQEGTYGLGNKILLTVTYELYRQGYREAFKNLAVYTDLERKEDTFSSLHIHMMRKDFGKVVDILERNVEKVFTPEFFVFDAYLSYIQALVPIAWVRERVIDVLKHGLEHLERLKGQSVILNSDEMSSLVKAVASFSAVGVEFDLERWLAALQPETQKEREDSIQYLAELAAFSNNQGFVEEAKQKLRERRNYRGLLIIALGQRDENLLQEGLDCFTKSEESNLQQFVSAFTWIEEILSTLESK